MSEALRAEKRSSQTKRTKKPRQSAGLSKVYSADSPKTPHELVTKNDAPKKRVLFKSDKALAENAGLIFKQAFDEAYEAGFEIVVRRGDLLVLIQKGQQDVILKELEPYTYVKPGTVFQLT
jgi:hypothetical protein